MFKRLENIKSKKEEPLQVIKSQGEKQLKELKIIDKNKILEITDESSNKKNAESNKLVPRFIELDETLEKVDLVCTKTDGTKYDFNRSLLPLKFIAKIYHYKITLDKAIQDQTKLGVSINKLNDYNLINTEKVEEKKEF